MQNPILKKEMLWWKNCSCFHCRFFVIVFEIKKERKSWWVRASEMVSRVGVGRRRGLAAWVWGMDWQLGAWVGLRVRWSGSACGSVTLSFELGRWCWASSWAGSGETERLEFERVWEFDESGGESVRMRASDEQQAKLAKRKRIKYYFNRDRN